MSINNEFVKVSLGFSAAMGAVGFLGGEAARLFIPSISAAGYGLTLGLWPLASAGIYALAEKINRDGGACNVAISLVGGYFASLLATNLLGFSVSALAPFAGVSALVLVGAAIALVAVPCLACVATSVACAN